jgi:hypothetical protein
MVAAVTRTSKGTAAAEISARRLFFFSTCGNARCVEAAAKPIGRVRVLKKCFVVADARTRTALARATLLYVGFCPPS